MSALVGAIVAVLILIVRPDGSWPEALSTGASVAFLTFLAVEVPNMVLNEYRVRSEREARERVTLELERERRGREREREAREREHAARLVAERRSERLMAVLVETLKDKGVDPKLLDALLEE